MKELWKATALLARDPAFTSALTNLANCVPRTDLDIPTQLFASLPPLVQQVMQPLNPQPDPTAVASIAAAFLNRGIHLGAYEVSEINRWLWLDRTQGAAIASSLQAYWLALGTVGLALIQQYPEATALLGVIAIDRRFRYDFSQNMASVADIGFSLQPAHESQLRGLMQPGGDADTAASHFDGPSWPGSCLAIAAYYDGYIHPNI